MKFKSEELADLIRLREDIDRWAYEAFENQAENEDYQRKRVRNRYKKDIEKTRACMLSVWWLDFKSIIKYKEPKVEIEKVTQKHGIIGFFRRLFGLNKKNNPEIEFPVDVKIDEMIDQSVEENTLKDEVNAETVVEEGKSNLETTNPENEQSSQDTAKDEQGA